MYPDEADDDADSNEDSDSAPAKSLTPEVTVVQETVAGPTPSPPPRLTSGRPNPTIVVQDHGKQGMETLYTPNDDGDGRTRGKQLPKLIRGKPVAGKQQQQQYLTALQFIPQII